MKIDLSEAYCLFQMLDFRQTHPKQRPDKISEVASFGSFLSNFTEQLSITKGTFLPISDLLCFPFVAFSSLKKGDMTVFV